MRHEKTVSVSKIKFLWEPWEEDEKPRKALPVFLLSLYLLKKAYRQKKMSRVISGYTRLLIF